jgi:ubiquinone/menaquinone biosynthesis C-methylase UbiE
MAVPVDNIGSFWQANVCGAHFVDEQYLSPEFFEAYRNFRYTKEHHLNDLIDWKSSNGKQILEVGLGLGADCCRWASHAKEYTGIDLTDEAVMATQRHLEILGLTGTIIQGNAEDLPFDDASFDIVYSHGVLHHTPNIDRAISEIYRVVKPTGEFIVMLYAKESLNYWLRIQGLFRLLFAYNLVRDLIHLQLDAPWNTHVSNYRRLGWKYFSWSNWPHRCTDGPDCEIANIYSWRQTRAMLSSAGFHINRTEKAHFPINGNKELERFLGKRLGFYRFVWCSKTHN